MRTQQNEDRIVRALEDIRDLMLRVAEALEHPPSRPTAPASSSAGTDLQMTQFENPDACLMQELERDPYWQQRDPNKGERDTDDLIG